MKKTNRPCWWCGKPLMAVSHAVLSDGRKVHKRCKDDAEVELRMVTARPSQVATVSPYDLNGLPEYPGE